MTSENDELHQVEIYKAANAQQAQLLRNLLEDAGIVAHVSGAMLQNTTEAAGWAVEPKVTVKKADEKAARLIAQEFDATVSKKAEPNESDPGGPSEIDEELLEQIRREEDWPKCPQCDSLRMAVCPHCEHRSTTLDAAEFIGADGAGGKETQMSDQPEASEIEIVPEVFQLMCSVCDRSFEPLYMKLCRCGYEFENGVEEEHYESDVNFRVLLIIALICCGVGVALLYWMSSI